MENLYEYFSIKKSLSLIFYVFGIFSPTDAKNISAVAGSTVSLQCNNKSISTLRQLTWTMNGDQRLFIFFPTQRFDILPEARSLNINMSDSESQLYALVIERAQESHTGNYTCETTTLTGVWEQHWELIITDPEEAENQNKLMIVVGAIVACVCLLIFIFALAIMLTCCKRRAENSVHSPPADTQERTVEIYENCLESLGHNQPNRNKRRAH